MSEQQELAERPIVFQGREMWVRLPSEEQIIVYGRTLDQLRAADTADWDGPQALKLLDRALRIIQTVLNPADREWIEDRMLDGELKLVEACQIMQLTVDAFTDGKTPAKKAAPKRAARRKAAA